MVEPVRRWDSAMPPMSAGTTQPGRVRRVRASAAKSVMDLVRRGVIILGYPGSGPGVDFVYPGGSCQGEHGDDEFGAYDGLDD